MTRAQSPVAAGRCGGKSDDRRRTLARRTPGRVSELVEGRQDSLHVPAPPATPAVRMCAASRGRERSTGRTEADKQKTAAGAARLLRRTGPCSAGHASPTRPLMGLTMRSRRLRPRASGAVSRAFPKERVTSGPRRRVRVEPNAHATHKGLLALWIAVEGAPNADR